MANLITRTDDPGVATVTGFSEAVVSALKDAGISRHDAAIRTNIPRESFYRKCRGGSPFDSEEQKRIAALLGVKVSELWLRAEARA